MLLESRSVFSTILTERFIINTAQCSNCEFVSAFIGYSPCCCSNYSQPESPNDLVVPCGNFSPPYLKKKVVECEAKQGCKNYKPIPETESEFQGIVRQVLRDRDRTAAAEWPWEKLISDSEYGSYAPSLRIMFNATLDLATGNLDGSYMACEECEGCIQALKESTP